MCTSMLIPDQTNKFADNLKIHGPLCTLARRGRFEVGFLPHNRNAFLHFEARRGYNSISLLSACVMIELPNGYPTLEWSAKQLVMDNPALYYMYYTVVGSFRKGHFCYDKNYYF